MKLVYLDQNKWIQLARVWHGKEKDADLVSLLRQVAEGAACGTPGRGPIFPT